MESQDIWNVQVEGRVYEAGFTELIEWIEEGAVTSDDLIQKGRLRWLSAGRVPELSPYFSKSAAVSKANDDEFLGQLERNGMTESELRQAMEPASSGNGGFHSTSSGSERALDHEAMKFCSVHPSAPTAFVCNICQHSFCSLCPNRFSSVRLCPSCGGVCTNYEELLESGVSARGALNKPYARKAIESAHKIDDATGKLRIRDFVRALIYPFAHPVDLAICSAFLIVCVLGMSLFLTGGLATTIAAIFSGLMTVGFGFDILSRISSNIEHGDRSKGFLPKRLYIDSADKLLYRLSRAGAAFFSTFGLFIILLSLAAGYAWQRNAESVAMTESAVEAARNSVDNLARTNPALATRSRLSFVLNDGQRNLMNPAAGYAYMANDIPIEKIVMSFMRLSVYFLSPIFILLVLGFVQLPASCASALQNRSIKDVLNPLRAVQQMRHLGFEYVKLVLVLISFVAAGSILMWATLFNLGEFISPLTGALIAVALLGIFWAIAWSAFSYTLALTLYRRTTFLESQV